MKVKIFWQEQCANCPPAKVLGKKLEGNGLSVVYYNTKEAEGLAESIMYDVMATPSIVVADDNDKKIAAWLGEVPSMADIENIKK